MPQKNIENHKKTADVEKFRTEEHTVAIINLNISIMKKKFKKRFEKNSKHSKEHTGQRGQKQQEQ